MGLNSSHSTALVAFMFFTLIAHNPFLGILGAIGAYKGSRKMEEIFSKKEDSQKEGYEEKEF